MGTNLFFHLSGFELARHSALSASSAVLLALESSQLIL